MADDYTALTPLQQQAFQQLAVTHPEFANAPEDLKQRYVALLMSGDPRAVARGLGDLQRQYPQFIKEGSFWKNPAALAGLGILTGGLASVAIPALAGGGAAAGSGASAGAAAGGGIVAGGGSSLLHSLLPTIIGAGTSLAGAGIASHGQTKAAELQAASADKALAELKRQYELQREDLAPYRNLGAGAVGNLSYLGGIAPPTLPAQAAPQASTALASLGAPHGTNPTNAPVTGQAMPRPGVQMVKVRSPSGQIGDVPAHLLPKALQAGGTQVS